MRNTLQLPYPSEEFWRKRVTEPRDGFYAIVACAGDELIGELDISTTPRPRRRHAGQIGMGVRDDWHGKGAGTALMRAAVEMADNWLNLGRLELEVFTDNEPAIRLYQKFGFVIEGTLREFGLRDGVFADAFAMARLKPR
jgi:putative acetyltransferase